MQCANSSVLRESNITIKYPEEYITEEVTIQYYLYKTKLNTN